MRYVIEYVTHNGLITKIQIDPHNYRDAMSTVDIHFKEISEFIGEGHVEVVNPSRDVAYCVHDDGDLIGMTPNLRPDLYHLLGSVVIVKATVDNVMTEIVGQKESIGDIMVPRALENLEV